MRSASSQTLVKTGHGAHRGHIYSECEVAE